MLFGLDKGGDGNRHITVTIFWFFGRNVLDPERLRIPVAEDVRVQKSNGGGYLAGETQSEVNAAVYAARTEENRPVAGDAVCCQDELKAGDRPAADVLKMADAAGEIIAMVSQKVEAGRR